jgi:carbonic anhydrase
MNIAIYRLIAGFKKFKEKYYHSTANDFSTTYQRLSVSGQTPKTLLIGCSDSRVDPAILTGASPGEIFVIRNVANLVPPCESSKSGLHGTSSAIEFAVTNLNVENIIVLGHRQCGGIHHLITKNSQDADSFVSKWMNIAASVKIALEQSELSLEEKCRFAEKESIKVSIQNLQSFPFIKDRLNKKILNILGVYFDLEVGQLFLLNEITNEFELVEI